MGKLEYGAVCKRVGGAKDSARTRHLLNLLVTCKELWARRGRRRKETRTVKKLRKERHPQKSQRLRKIKWKKKEVGLTLSLASHTLPCETRWVCVPERGCSRNIMLTPSSAHVYDKLPINYRAGNCAYKQLAGHACLLAA